MIDPIDKLRDATPVSDSAPRDWPKHEPEHGRYTTYVNYGCRCQPCTEDNTRYIREYRQRKRRWPPTKWHATIPCHGKTELFFGPAGERPEAHRKRVAKARELCMTCQHRTACDQLASRHDETGVWAGIERKSAYDRWRERNKETKTQRRNDGRTA